MPAARPKPPGRRGAMTGPANTAAAWLEQAPPTITAGSPELPDLHAPVHQSRADLGRVERRIRRGNGVGCSHVPLGG